MYGTMTVSVPCIGMEKGIGIAGSCAGIPVSAGTATRRGCA